MPTPTLTQKHPPLPLDELVRRIHAFPHSTFSNKLDFIRTLVGVHPTLNIAWKNGWRYRRVRKLSRSAPANELSDLLWPPSNVGKPGRASSERHPVFYVSDRVDTALRELDVEDEDVLLSEFEIRPNHMIHICPIGEISQVVRTGRGFLLQEGDFISDMLNACERQDARSLAMTDAFLFEQMVGHDDYEITSHLVECIFQKNSIISTVVYPSRRQRGALNFAVKIDGFWENWGLHSARRCHARHLGLGFHQLSDIRHLLAVQDDQSLEWSHQTDDLEAVAPLEALYAAR